MALMKVKKDELVAHIVKGKKLPCAFCNRTVDDEVNYGKLYAIGDIQCHYFCALLSCCLVQKGKDEVGLFGFLYQDILAEVARAKKHKCSYCLLSGASMGCCFTQCRKQFHLPCGLERNAVSLFYGNYKSYCQLHAPKQKIPENIMAKAKLRKKFANKGCGKRDLSVNDEEKFSDLEAVCVICYEEVPGYPTAETFWPPCCAKDAWFHRSCLQRMSLSAGMHYLKCPLCNDKTNFYEAVVSQGYYVPDRDAAWELEQNAFAEIYERPVSCNAVNCECPLGRSHDVDNGSWDITLCILCGSTGIHVQCQKSSGSATNSGRYVCAICQPAAPADLESLAASIEAVISAEENSNIVRTRRGPVMPSRMSVRRTKGRAPLNVSSTSYSKYNDNHALTKDTTTPSTTQSRQDLNLKAPKRPQTSPQRDRISLTSPITSPIKLLERSIHEKNTFLDIKNVLDENVVDGLKKKLQRPRPLSAKRRIFNEILNKILDNVDADKLKLKEPIKEWCSPKKCCEGEIQIQDSTATYEVLDKVLEPHQYGSDKIDNYEDKNVSEGKSDRERSLDNTTNDLKDIDNNDVITLKNNDLIPKTINLNKIETANSPSTYVKEKPANTDYDVLTYKEKPQHTISKDALDLFHSKHTVEANGNEVNHVDESLDDRNEIPAQRNLDLEDLQKQNVTKDDLQIFSTPKNLKTIDIENDSSIEISKDNQTINIDVIKMENSTIDNFKLPLLKSPVKNEKCFLKFSATDKEVLQNTNFNLDLESFKNQYLNEVDGERTKNNNLSNTNANDGIKKNIRKRKLDQSAPRKLRSLSRPKRKKLDSRRSSLNTRDTVKIEGDNATKEEVDETTCIPTPQLTNNKVNNKAESTMYCNQNINDETTPKKPTNTKQNNKTQKRRRLIKDTSIRRIRNKVKTPNKKIKNTRNNVQVAIDLDKGNRRNKKIKTKLSIRSKKLELKIKWREERFNLRITESKRKRKFNKNKKCFKQYVLKYNVGDAKVIAKPDCEISPPKRKYVKHEKQQDKLVQTSIVNFFMKMPSSSDAFTQLDV